MKGLGNLLGPYGSGKHSKGSIESPEASRRKRAKEKMGAASRKKNRTAKKNRTRKKIKRKKGGK